MQRGGIKDLIYNLLLFKIKPSDNYNTYCLIFLEYTLLKKTDKVWFEAGVQTATRHN
jgi:hypothetical protein